MFKLGSTPVDDINGPAMTNPLTQGRLELKYCVPEPIAAHVLDAARGHLVPEPLAPGAHQRVTSLYLDTPDLAFLRWHRERASDRYKVRIRGYGKLPAATLYVELKSKSGSVVRKERDAFPAAALGAVVGQCRAKHRATPRMLVSVVRESLRDPNEATAVTVDRALRYQSTTWVDMVGDAREWKPLPLPSCVGLTPVLVELKFGAEAPEWMAALVAELVPWRVSYSKYATAMNCVDHTTSGVGCATFAHASFESTVSQAA